MESIYCRNDTKTILSGGVANKLFLSGADLVTCTYVEKLLGSETRFEKDEVSRIVGSPLFTSDQVHRLKNSKCILVSEGYRPAKIRMKPYFQDRHLKKLAQLDPVTIGYDYMNGVLGYFKPKIPYLEHRVTVLEGLNRAAFEPSKI